MLCFVCFLQITLQIHAWESSVNKNLITENTVFSFLKTTNNVTYLFFLVLLQMLFVAEHRERAATEAAAAGRQQTEKF